MFAKSVFGRGEQVCLPRRDRYSNLVFRHFGGVGSLDDRCVFLEPHDRNSRLALADTNSVRHWSYCWCAMAHWYERGRRRRICTTRTIFQHNELLYVHDISPCRVSQQSYTYGCPEKASVQGI